MTQPQTTNATAPTAPSAGTFFSPEEEQRFRSRWESIQASFVDAPKQAVQHADELVGDITDRIVDAFRRDRSAIEGQWARNTDVSTEDLRTCLQQYRSYLNDLLARTR